MICAPENKIAPVLITLSSIPMKTVIAPFSGRLAFCNHNQPSCCTTELRLSSNGLLLDEQISFQWTNNLAAARDCTEQNLEICLTASTLSDKNGLINHSIDQFSVRTVRNVSAGEILCAWFSDQLVRFLNLPILQMNNIRGEECYACNTCDKQFAYPNLLKAHIMTDCSCANLPQDEKIIPSASKFFQLVSPLSPHSTSTCQSHKIALKLPFYTPWIIQPNFKLPQSQDSKFSQFPVPYFSSQHHSALLLGQSEKINRTNFSKESNHFDSSDNDTTLSSKHANYEFADRNKISALDSNDIEPLDVIPKSLYACKMRKGHLCIYCGKVYSRKYGLKIHLRTHTGYKPLKCKVCMRPFGDPSNLNKHIRLHAEGDTPYRCGYCAKVLVRRRDLERHIRSRHPENWFTFTNFSKQKYNQESEVK